MQMEKAEKRTRTYLASYADTQILRLKDEAAASCSLPCRQSIKQAQISPAYYRGHPHSRNSLDALLVLEIIHKFLKMNVTRIFVM